ncbi:C40 family peptidase [Kutzneria kofuensis]|uniref:Cell wall-associated NlpC family hydrolase n=1 Tax=Kutzneria kofuensis TaxID=103725 RepID=A0A7W9KDA2_9PSEU|nr:NlpC/P60 family protein [Kutzneria kofuensis]MBB5890456.1 cell wall-associated NlpC family hydrolase [Kutzneria kofuensis]
MASNRLKHVMRGALAVSAVATVVGLNPGSAVADPPSNLQDAKTQLDAASKAAEVADQAYLAAQDDLKAKQAEVAKATADIQTYTQQAQDAKAKETQYQGQVDQLASAAYSGVQFTQLSALLTGKSAQDFLDQSSELQFLAQQNAAVMDGYDNAIKTANSAKAKAADAQKKSQEAADAAQKILGELDGKKKAADQAKDQAQSIYNQLDAAAKGLLKGAGDTGVFLGPPGAAGTAMNAAVGERGVPYVWGGTTPNPGFDCSGLMLWSYAKAGIQLPRSAAAQYTVGKAVSLDALQPGDLIFYGSTASNIHHVSMYVGAGKVVHAPTEGEVVKIVPIGNSGSDIFGAKRIVG